MGDVKRTVHMIMQQVFGVKPETVDYDKSWDELGIESFELVEFVLAVREHFGIRIDSNHFDKIRTLNDLLSFLEKQKCVPIYKKKS